jgi:membrane peptidoglycan carboxypeptidase
VFFTGGGDQVFRNFDKSEDHLNPTVEQAFTLSINLSFIRLLRDLTRYYSAQEQDLAQLRSVAAAPLRQDYLRHFADQEGQAYLNRFYDDYHRLGPEQVLDLLADRAYDEPRSLALVFRALRPRATVQELGAFLRPRLPKRQLDPQEVQDLFDQNYPDRYSLNDQGFLAGVHPLELWLVVWLQAHPGATRTELMLASTEQRQEVYAWLMRSQHSASQDRRIGILLEQRAFEKIHQDWQRQGYPFGRMVPSLASAIGSSGDRPDALAELMGIVANGGVQLPAVDIESLHFAAATPYETSLRYVPAAPRRVLRPEVAATVRQALEGVVDHGTAQRLRGSYQLEQAEPLPMGGKTGTGDNRFDTFGPGRQLIDSRLVNRSATFVFFLGTRYFGAVTAYVSGEGADDFHFTSSLVVQLLRGLAPALQPLLEREQAGEGQQASADGCRALPQDLVLSDVTGWLEQSSFGCWSGASAVAAVPPLLRNAGRKPGEDAPLEAARTARRAAPVAAPAGDG